VPHSINTEMRHTRNPRLGRNRRLQTHSVYGKHSIARLQAGLFGWAIWLDGCHHQSRRVAEAEVNIRKPAIGENPECRVGNRCGGECHRQRKQSGA